MTGSNQYAIARQMAAPRMIAAVHVRLPIHAVRTTFKPYLDQVYAAARAGAVNVDGQNVFVYLDTPDRPTEADVSFGVGVTAPFVAVGAVAPTSLPGGEVAVTTHWGSYAKSGNAHEAVIEWCRTNGRRRAGARWEVYGHWTDDEAYLRTDVFHLLEPAEAASGRLPTEPQSSPAA